MNALLQALDSPRRREILRLIWARELQAGEIHRSLGKVTFGAVSQQLSILKRAGLVERRREGQKRFYRAQKESLGVLAPWLESMWEDSLARLGELAEAEQSALSASDDNRIDS